MDIPLIEVDPNKNIMLLTDGQLHGLLNKYHNFAGQKMEIVVLDHLNNFPESSSSESKEKVESAIKIMANLPDFYHTAINRALLHLNLPE